MRSVVSVNVRAVVAEDIKELAQKFKALNLLRQVVVVLCCLLTLGLPPWLLYMNERWTTEMQYLYGQAIVGDRESVRKMARHRLWGTSWLESLARDRDAFAESRVAAIDELADKRFISRKPLVPLLWIEQPFDVRHEAALMFLKRGCDEECIKMTLRCLHSLRTGRPAVDASLSQEENNYSVQLWARSTKDYLDLLNSNPCMSEMSLRSKYASDHSFIADIERSLTVCSSRGGT
jgi:hypothetical protein